MLETINHINREVFLALNFDGGPFLDDFFWIVTGKLTWVPLYMLILYIFYRKLGLRNMIIATVCIGAMVVCVDMVCNFFKEFFPVPRPTRNEEISGLVHTVRGYRGGFSGTVSAHAAISFGVAVLSSLLIRSRVYSALIIFWATLVAYSRIYVGVHYPKDIFFGIITGTTLAVLAFLLYRKAVSRADRNVRK